MERPVEIVEQYEAPSSDTLKAIGDRCSTPNGRINH
jgi:hypothetical protein